MSETAISLASIAGHAAFFLVMAAAIFSVVLGFPGTWIILLEAAVYAAVLDFEGPITLPVIGVLGGLALLGEIMEFALTAYGAGKFGEASKSAMAGAVFGGLAGAIVLAGTPPVIGSILGAFLGVFAGAALVTYAKDKDGGKALKAGVGAFFGRLGAVMMKGACAVAMAGVIVARVFF
jgi:hypothetical protein